MNEPKLLDGEKYWDLLKKYEENNRAKLNNKITKNKIIECCNYANFLYKLVIDDCKLKQLDFSFNRIATKSKLGQFTARNKNPFIIKINIAEIILQSKEDYLDGVKEVVLHEIAHYIQYNNFGYSDHSKMFLRIEKELQERYIFLKQKNKKGQKINNLQLQLF